LKSAAPAEPPSFSASRLKCHAYAFAVSVASWRGPATPAFWCTPPAPPSLAHRPLRRHHAGQLQPPGTSCALHLQRCFAAALLVSAIPSRIFDARPARTRSHRCRSRKGSGAGWVQQADAGAAVLSASNAAEHSHCGGRGGVNERVDRNVVRITERRAQSGAVNTDHTTTNNNG
jgi:hypothetical protein